jgi:hypothetical protein
MSFFVVPAKSSSSSSPPLDAGVVGAVLPGANDEIFYLPLLYPANISRNYIRACGAVQLSYGDEEHTAPVLRSVRICLLRFAGGL